MSNTEQTKRAWKRTLLGVVFAGMCMAMAVLEVNALRVLRKGQEFESQSLYRTAAMAYGMVVEKYAFSFSVVRAKEGLDRIAPVLEDGGQVDRFHHSTIQSLMGSRFSPYEMDFAPLVFSLLAAVLFMALLSSPQGRQRRWLSLMTLTALACLHIAVQGVWAGLWHQDSLMTLFSAVQERPVVSYLAAYALLLLSVLMTLAPKRTAVEPASRIDPTAA